jgi:ADP-ribosyl-[dinitrogen reductase] hydrolase
MSPCRLNDDGLLAGVEQIDIRLIDDIDLYANPNLDFVLAATVRIIEQLRNEERTALLHCVACQSRTPTVAALYGARKRGISGEAALGGDLGSAGGLSQRRLPPSITEAGAVNSAVNA